MSLPQFTAFLKTQRLSSKTIRDYRSDVNKFLDWIKTPPSLLQPHHFLTYKTYLASQKTPLSTFHRHLASLRKFASFLKLPLDLKNPPLPLIPTTLKNFKSHLTKSRYKSKTIANYLSDVKHYLHWAQAQQL